MLGEIVEKIKLSRYGLLSNFRLFCSFRYRTGFFGGETAVQKGFLALARAADIRGRRKLALRMQKPIAYKKGGAFVA